MWRSFFRGLNLLYMDNYVGADSVGLKATKEAVEIRAAIGLTRLLAQHVNIGSFVPSREVASTGYALKSPYALLVYVPDASPLTVDLRAHHGEFLTEWFNIQTGSVVAGPELHGERMVSLAAPDSDGSILYLTGLRSFHASPRANSRGRAHNLAQRGSSLALANSNALRGSSGVALHDAKQGANRDRARYFAFHWGGGRCSSYTALGAVPTCARDWASQARARAAMTNQVINAFTVDVEDYFHVSALASAIPRDSWSQRERRVERSTENLLALLAEFRVQGTFFVLGWVAEHCPDLIRRIAASGHEVGCHGYSHELVYRQGRTQFQEETVRSKHLLEDLTGVRVAGYRAASFSITRESQWALDILIDLGFEYDSSVFPVRHDRYGMPNAARFPGVMTSPSGKSLVEFPMSTASYLGLRVPISGGGYFRLLPYWFVRAGLRQVNRNARQPFTFYLHPWEIDVDQPRVSVGWLSRFRHYTNLDKCEARLRRLLGEFQFAPMRAVLEKSGLLSSAQSVLHTTHVASKH